MNIDPQVWSIAWLSVQVSASAVAISSAIGIPLGGWLGLSRTRLNPLIKALAHTGMALPPVIVGLLLYVLLSQSGPLAFLGWLFTPQAMVLAQVILTLPFVVGITMTAVDSVPQELVAQLQSLGASRRQTRWAILVEARRGVLLAVAAAFGRSISEVGAVIIVGGNILGHTRILTTAIVLETGAGNFRLALAMGGLLLAAALTVNLLILRLHGRKPIL